jgi:hypothetical protein
LRKSTGAQQAKDVLRSRRLAGPPQVNDKCGLSLGNRVPWRERYQLSVTEATGSVVPELVCTSGSKRRGQFCSQRSKYCRSRDRNLSGGGVFEFHHGCMIAMPMPSAWRRSPLGRLDMSCLLMMISGFPMDHRHHLRTDRRNGKFLSLR